MLVDIPVLIHALDSSSWWIVFFAPSAAEFVAPILQKFFDLPPCNDSPHNSGFLPKLPANLATIGPTTCDFIHDKLKLEVAVCSDRPTPEDLTTGISKHIAS